MSDLRKGFAGRVVRWQETHGRSGLPWQQTRDPYRVWLSEVMLQQTQVATVLGYYERFLERFPDVRSLAQASIDDVYGLWSGLGYYSRARNLHRCAQDVVELHSGEFPRTAEQLQMLPGIGRSTAAAIASFCFGERVAILDGNVKRVLARVLAFEDDLARASNQEKLWTHAQMLLPASNLHETMPRYTQGLMDLGATVCLARNPGCLICPVSRQCAAFKLGEPEKFPVKTRKLKRTSQSLWLLLAREGEGRIWLEKRPDSGIWAGLYCLPVFESLESLVSTVNPGEDGLQDGAPFVHVLTHKDLYLHPVSGEVSPAQLAGRQGAWFAPVDWPKLGLPAPVRKLLESQ